MDPTKRQMTKIAREVSKLAGRMLRDQGIGTAEFDVVHVIRKIPGSPKPGSVTSSASTRAPWPGQIASLEAKGFLIRKENPQDGRSQLLYATEKADQLKNSKAYIESVFYEWLLEPLSDQQRQEFAATLETLYLRSREQSPGGIPGGRGAAGREGSLTTQKSKIRLTQRKMGAAFCVLNSGRSPHRH